MGDEGFYPKVKSTHIQSVIGDEVPEDIDSSVIFESLRNQFHVFFIHKPYWDKEVDKRQLAKWKAVVGEDRILELTDPKSIVDIILGAIAIVGRSRSLEEYKVELAARGQTTERIEDVSRSLKVIMDRLNNPVFPPPGSLTNDDVPYVVKTTTNTTITSSVSNLSASIDWPAEYKCPITEEPFVDPVIAKDGYTYERVAIHGWLTQNGSSPMTGQVLPVDLIENISLKQSIAQFKAKYNL